ncbi:MAG: hypothetical protein ACI30P_05475 [Muribaculaceae bacterium]
MNNRTLTEKWSVILMLSVFLCLSSCGLPYCKKTKFSKADLSWLNVYSIGDRVIFADSEKGKFDTLVVTDKSIYDPSNTFILDVRGCNWMEGSNEYKAIADYEFDIYHDGEKYNGRFVIEKLDCSDPAVALVSLMGRFAINPVSTSSITSDLPEFPQYKTNIVMTESNLHSGESQPVVQITEIYWNREAGLIGYRTSSSLYKVVKQ